MYTSVNTIINELECHNIRSKSTQRVSGLEGEFTGLLGEDVAKANGYSYSSAAVDGGAAAAAEVGDWRFQVAEFAKGAAEMSVEFGKGVRDVMKQSILRDDSVIMRKFKGPCLKILGKLSFLNEYLPEDRDPVHAWTVIACVWVFLLAGIPGLKGALLHEFGVRLVTYDLPGFGESDPHPDRDLESSALDMLHLSYAVNVTDKFWVVGYSDGSKYAWAALHYIPDRLAGKSSGRGQNVQDFWQRDVEESVRQANAKPFVEEAVLQVSNWGFSIAELNVQNKRTGKGIISWLKSVYNPAEKPLNGFLGPIHIWQGAEDTVVPPSMSDFVHRVVPDVMLHKLPYEGHFSYFYFCDECHRQIFTVVFEILKVLLPRKRIQFPLKLMMKKRLKLFSVIQQQI
ncbi:hypothetical protein DH2020_021292 [Rehmannia glutinosa]|uniref:AB hydrolase-1 domain-containing protein n=1 Tax=Rehmannia glutinosa TaxID=99300 RepID=A0ABR0WAM9_REHGL